MDNSRSETKSTMNYHHAFHNTWILDLMSRSSYVEFMVTSSDLVQAINRQMLQPEMLDPSCGHQNENDNEFLSIQNLNESLEERYRIPFK